MSSSSSTPLDFFVRHRGIIAILVAAAAVRLADLSLWWLNPDEGIYYSYVTRAQFTEFWSSLTGNAHPPLYYLLLRGLAGLTWNFVWLRAFSVVCGIAAVAGVWAVGRHLGGEGEKGTVAGFVAALVLAFAPAAVELSQVMRPYMLQLALLSWGFFFLLKYIETGAARDLGGYILLLCLALLTHYSSILALGVLAVTATAEGLRRGSWAPSWRRLAWSHLIPAALVLLLYFGHLRELSTRRMSQEALEGWLSFYMISAPADLWWSYLGFQHLLAEPWLRGPLALLLLVAVGLALGTRRWRVGAPAAAAILVAFATAAVGLYPFGATRHSVWLLAFTVPALGWLGASLLDATREAPGRLRFGMVLALLALGGPVGDLLGVEKAPWAPSDRVLREEELGTMVDVLDPSAEPELIIMSLQTFYLLTPFYPAERENSVFSDDRRAFYFPYGQRKMLVSHTWTFDRFGAAARSTGEGERSSEESGEALGPFLKRAQNAFPALELGDRETAVLLIGGWRPPFVDDLLAPAARDGGIVQGSRSVRGFYAFEIDLQVLRAQPSLSAGQADDRSP